MHNLDSAYGEIFCTILMGICLGATYFIASVNIIMGLLSKKLIQMTIYKHLWQLWEPKNDWIIIFLFTWVHNQSY
jgi:hypothetical protein